MHPTYNNNNWRNISTIYILKTRLASNEIFSLSNKIHREVGRAEDLSAPFYLVLQVYLNINNVLNNKYCYFRNMSITLTSNYLVGFLLGKLKETGLKICTKDDKIRRIVLFHGALVHYEGRWYNTVRLVNQTYCYCFRLGDLDTKRWLIHWLRFDSSWVYLRSEQWVGIWFMLNISCRLKDHWHVFNRFVRAGFAVFATIQRRAKIYFWEWCYVTG